MRKYNRTVIEPDTFPLLLEGRCTIGAISVRLSGRHIHALFLYAFHLILHIADLKDERKKFFKS